MLDGSRRDVFFDDVVVPTFGGGEETHGFLFVCV